MPELIALLRRLKTRTLVDAPCGDFNWIAEAADSVDRYVGMDVVPELIEHNLRHYVTDRRNFALADITRDVLPPADVILCRDCLVHYSDSGRLDHARELPPKRLALSAHDDLR